jgi:M6 family metalloprotease-like protein
MEDMTRYFEEVSQGRVSLTWKVQKDWKLLPKTMEYYGEEAKRGVDKNLEYFVVDSIKAWSEVSFVPYSYALVVHAGPDQSETHEDNDIWSSCYSYSGHVRRISDTMFAAGAANYIWGVGVVSEQSDMGTFAHEFAHALGLPDLYSYENHGPFVGNFSLMDEGSHLGTPDGSSPSYLDAWSQIHLGWMSYEQWTSNQTAVSIQVNPLETAGGTKAVKVPLGRFTYYQVEVRKKIGFDQSLPDEGVLITFVDDALDSGEGIVRAIDSTKYTDSLDDAMFSVGETFADSENRVYISVLGVEVNGYAIRFSNMEQFHQTTTTTEALTSTSSLTYSSKQSEPLALFPQYQSLLMVAAAIIATVLVGMIAYRRTGHGPKLSKVYCTYCGSAINVDSEYCGYCGKRKR